MGEFNFIELFKPEKGSCLELKPCPFCGSDEIVYAKYNHAAGERWRVFCTHCMAGVDPGYAQTEHCVQKMWNRRV